MRFKAGFDAADASILEIFVTPPVEEPVELDWRARRRISLRAAILASAEDLILETGGTDFTMKNLAEKAGVALATPYSLFGSKGAVLYALIGECVRTIDLQAKGRKISDPIDQILEVSRISAELYGGEPTLYRPLLRYMGHALEHELHLALFIRSMHIWRPAVDRGVQLGVLRRDTRKDVLERQLLMNFVGVVGFWVQEELDADGFRNHVLFGTGLILTRYVKDQLRPALFKRIAKHEKEIPSGLLPVEPSKTRSS